MSKNIPVGQEVPALRPRRRGAAARPFARQARRLAAEEPAELAPVWASAPGLRRLALIESSLDRHARLLVGDDVTRDPGPSRPQRAPRQGVDFMNDRTDPETQESASILVVDPNEADREALQAMLADAGFAVATAASARDVRNQLAAQRIDAAVIDPHLSDCDGLTLVHELAGDPSRVVFVVAWAEDPALPDRSYASGAGDFAYKPIVRNELLARLRKALRERSTAGGEARPRLTLRREERICILDGREIALTRHERNFLGCLIDAPRHFATYAQLIRAVWGDGHAVETQHLRVLAAQVRRKIETEGAVPILRTVTGEGFRLDLGPEG